MCQQKNHLAVYENSARAVFETYNFKKSDSLIWSLWAICPLIGDTSEIVSKKCMTLRIRATATALCVGRDCSGFGPFVENKHTAPNMLNHKVYYMGPCSVMNDPSSRPTSIQFNQIGVRSLPVQPIRRQMPRLLRWHGTSSRNWALKVWLSISIHLGL